MTTVTAAIVGGFILVLGVLGIIFSRRKPKKEIAVEEATEKRRLCSPFKDGFEAMGIDAVYLEAVQGLFDGIKPYIERDAASSTMLLGAADALNRFGYKDSFLDDTLSPEERFEFLGNKYGDIFDAALAEGDDFKATAIKYILLEKLSAFLPLAARSLQEIAKCTEQDMLEPAFRQKYVETFYKTARLHGAGNEDIAEYLAKTLGVQIRLAETPKEQAAARAT